MIDENTTVVDAMTKITVGDVGSGLHTAFIVFAVFALIMFIIAMTSRPRF